MKRIIAITVTVLLVSAVIFSGCAEPAEPTEPTTPTEPTEPTKPTEPTEPVKPIEWTFASFIPPFDVYATEAENWAKGLEEATDGRLKITCYFAESFVKMPGLPDAVSAGTAQLAQAYTGGLPGRFPLGQVFNLVMIFDSPSQAGQTAIALINKYKEFQDEYYPTKVVWYQCPGPSNLFTTKVPVHTMEDLKGLKIASVGAYEIKAYELLGATPLMIFVAEVYHALETGVSDGNSTDHNGQWISKNQEVTKYRTDNINMSMFTFPTLMNIEAYNNLPGDIRGIFDELTDPAEFSRRINKEWEEFANGSAAKIKEFDKKVGNPEWYVLPEAERERWKEVVWPVNEEWASQMEAKGLPGKAVLADAIAFAEQYK